MDEKQASSTSIVSELLEGLPKEEVQETETIEKEPVEEKTEVEKDEPVELTITEEFASRYRLSQNLIGKPISQLGETYKNLVADYTRKSQERSALEKRIGELEEQMLKQATTKTEKQEVRDIFDDMPDSYEKPAEFKKWLKNALANERDAAKKETLLEIEEKIKIPLSKVESFEQKNRNEQIYQSIQDSVPEGTNVDELIVEWGEANGIIGDKDTIDYFLSRPQLMAKAVQTFFEAKEAKKLQEKVGDEAVKKAATNLKETKQKKASDLNSVTRQKEESTTPKVVKDILKDLE